MVKLNKWSGFTPTERILAEFCERSFLKLWSYPNPYKDDGHELCDLIAVFGNHVFIFFVRENQLIHDTDKDLQVLWERWKRNVVDRQTKTAHGAERYIRSGRSVFLDPKCTTQFPLPIEPPQAVFHKIIVAHGAKDACKQASSQNIYGSLAITYSADDTRSKSPFHISIDKHNPIHIFDSHNLPIVLSELDTVSDFATYLDEKLRAISELDSLSYCGEEDLLGHYLLNYDNTTKRHFIGTKRADVNSVLIGEGEWYDFIQTALYKNTKSKDQISYFWDELIQRTCHNALEGTLGGNSDLFRGESAIYEMVKEPRFIRRAISEKIEKAVVGFPDQPGRLTRQVTFIPSFRRDVGYVFFQLRVTEEIRQQPDYLDKRRFLLEIACGAAKNKFSHLTKVVGIGMDAPKFSGDTNSEDFILLNCEEWSIDTQAFYEVQNRDWNFFETPHLKAYKETVTEFVQPPMTRKYREGSIKIGRNNPCPCGSGKKYKKCHASQLGHLHK